MPSVAQHKAKSRSASRPTGRKRVYFFGLGQAEGRADMKALLGGKGANLAEMTNLGVPVPPGFTLTTEACREFYEQGERWPEGLAEELVRNLALLEAAMGLRFGDKSDPLIVSVRSGAAVSMPGMMDTVLNLGLNSDVLQGLIIKTENERFAWDAYRRFIQMFGDVVMGVDRAKFEAVLHRKKEQAGVQADSELSAGDLKEIVRHYKKIYHESTGEEFPADPREQLRRAINAVFRSWNNPRAVKYRQLYDIRGLLGTAVNVQAMVFGNMGEDSGTGVCFTRNPSTGERIFYGEFLTNAQGEDVVAGIRTPQPISELRRVMPNPYVELVKIKDRLERHYRDMQDIEFTIQKGKLYLLQTRNGKRTAHAAVKIACDLTKEGLISRNEAVLRVEAKSLDQLLHPTFDPKAPRQRIAKGLPASPGAATGAVVFSAHEAEEWAARGQKVILVRIETSPEDIGGMHVAQGILTARGGMTSHAAVVARGMGKCCVAGCTDVSIDYASKQFFVGSAVVREGDAISLDGSTGEVFLGVLPTRMPEFSGDFGRLMKWADELRSLAVRTNADTPHDAKVARGFGAEGIGLCRTEHMFFDGERIISVRKMILAESIEERQKALAELLPMQRGDFEGIFREMNGLPVTIRLLDPPLHEFLPKEEDAQREMANVMGVPLETVRAKVQALSEVNPMLGHRGCRLGITFPEIYDMQVRAILEAACRVKREGVSVKPEIMIPLVGVVQELRVLRQRAARIITQVLEREHMRIPVLIGTMIEVPRAAIVASEIAGEAEFFSFGTNDLTQMTFGFSRDDAANFLGAYLEQGVLEVDPFQSIDQEGVGALMRWATDRGRMSRPDLKVGICGEHGGDPATVAFCHGLGMNYVSCSPYRVPIARLAAAQAVLRAKAAAKKHRR